MKYVIIGNSVAGIAAVESIREIDKDGTITIISDEQYLNYSRPLISYLLAKKISSDKIYYKEESFYEKNNVELLLNTKAVKLELSSDKRQVILANKKAIDFDKLLISTGGIPTIPEIKGTNINGVFTFTKLSDAETIEKYIQENKVKNAVIIGGGLIGLKATEALIELNIKVTIVELADRILSSTFDKKASNIIENALNKAGCSIVTNNTVTEIKEEKNKVSRVILKDGKEIHSDLIIIAIGVKPNIDLTINTPIKTKRGILVNNFMETNINNIYAAGDCCEATDSLTGITRPIAIWPLAAKQGRIAGSNMAGMRKEYEGGFPMNSVELVNIPTISVGETYPEGKDFEIIEYTKYESNVYKKLVLKNNRIIGAIFIGDIERAGIYTGLISDQVNTESFKKHLLKEDFGLISLPKEYRKHMVTGLGIEV